MIVVAGPKTCHWGYFDADLPPVATIASGGEVTINTVSGGPNVLPSSGFHIPPELLEIHAIGIPSVPGHILTGPVAVEGAMPGDVLQIDILDVKLRQDWGYTFIRPLSGTLPLDFPTPSQMTVALDADKAEATLPWGLKLPLSPFFGVMAVAPPRNWGRISTIEPRAHGGISTTRSWSRAQRSICRCLRKVPCFPAGTGMAHRVTGKSASPLLRLHCRGASG